MKRRVLRSGVVIVAVAVLTSGWAAAGIFGVGLDYMKTQPGSVWDFASDPIPAGTFGFGSNAFGGKMHPFTLTKVGRGAGVAYPDGFYTIPTEIVAMTLHSVEPIAVSYSNGGPVDTLSTRFFDVVVTLGSTPSTGLYRVTRDPSGGDPDHGTIFANGGEIVPPDFPAESFFDVFFDFEFIPHDGGQSYHHQAMDHVALTADVPWNSMAPAPYYHDGAGGFFPGVAFPPDPCIPETLVFQGQSFTWHLGLEPIPEPATLALLAVGGLGLLRRRRRREAPSTQ